MAAFSKPCHRNDFEIAIICALPVESDAVQAVFDEFWKGADYGKAQGDTNAYTLGRIGHNNVVLVHMPGMGKAKAAAVASGCRYSFPDIKLALAVGICGGVPGGTDEEKEVLLGDVVISTGIIQYDFGRRFDHRFVRKDSPGNDLSKPEDEIQGFLNKLRGQRNRQLLREKTSHYLTALLEDHNFENARYLGVDEDRLFEATYRHKHHNLRTCTICTRCKSKEDEVCETALELSCTALGCDENKQVPRKRLAIVKQAVGIPNDRSATTSARADLHSPIIHFGLVASGDSVMKSGEERDMIYAKENVIAFEMEGAGIWNNIPCVVIKGISDYADAHKNKKWQGYAAATSVACMKAFLEEWTFSDKQMQRPLPPSYHNEERMRSNEQAFTGRQLSHSKEIISACLRTLSYSSIDDRQHNIAFAHQDTCQWLFNTRTFLQWWTQDDLPSHNGVLWIKGKPGAGKSTLMKHTLLYCREEFEDRTIAAYFFNARGYELERTILGMLRSLLYQLVEGDSILCESFVQKYLEKEKKHGKCWEWSVLELQNFLHFETKKGRIKPLLVLVDALDECDEPEVRKVVEFLEDLSISAVNAKVTLHICLSSRHYPTIDIKSKLELKLEDQGQHDQDIIKYVRNKLRVRDRNIEEELLRKADHVFLWVVLVVEMLNQAFDRGKIRALQKKLEDVPSDLDGIFLSILQKDSPDKEATLLMFQWVLFTKEILRPEQLYFAVLAGTEPEGLGAWDHPTEETHEAIKRYITSTSRGLIEVRKGATETVQFIHESINDFFLRNKRLQTLDDSLQQHAIGASHDRLVACCMAYIAMKDLDEYANEDTPAKIWGGIQMRRGGPRPGFIDQFPFLEYAVSHVLYHAEMAQAGCISQQAYIERLLHGDFRRLMIFHNAFFTILSKTYTEELIYAVSLDGYFELAKVVLQDNTTVVNAKGGFFGSALQAASYHTRKLAPLLIDKGADVNLQGGFYGTALQAASARGNKELVALLLDKGADVNLQDGIYGTALQAASMYGSKELVALLLENGADVNLRGGYYGSALGAASHRSNKEVIGLLLEHEGQQARIH